MMYLAKTIRFGAKTKKVVVVGIKFNFPHFLILLIFFFAINVHFTPLFVDYLLPNLILSVSQSVLSSLKDKTCPNIAYFHKKCIGIEIFTIKFFEGENSNLMEIGIWNLLHFIN